MWTTLALDGDLPAIEGSFSPAPSFVGSIPAIEGAFVCYPAQPAYLDGDLGAITGAFNSPETFGHLHGELAGLTSAFTGLSGNTASFSSSIFAIQGDFVSSGWMVVTGFSGILPALTGDYVATWSGTNALAGDLPAILGSFYIEGVVTARRVIAMNLSHHAVTHYENFNYSSVAHYGDYLVATNETGLYLVGGENDLGDKIEAEIRSGKNDLSWKVPREAWMAYQSDGDAIFTVKTDKARDAYEYSFVPQTKTEEGRAKVGKGIKGRFFTFGIKNKSGTRLHINILRIFGDIIKRLSR
jgi:hypothetical protein